PRSLGCEYAPCLIPIGCRSPRKRGPYFARRITPHGGQSRCVIRCRELRGRFGVSHEFPSRRSVMRRTILALTVIFLAPTAVMAMTAGRELVGDPELGAAGAAIQKRQIAPGGVAGIGHGGFLGGNVILAKGDKKGTGPGL